MMVIGCSKKDDWPVLKGSYLGQKSPGMTAKLFAPGIVSTGQIDRCAWFTPDGNEFYFSVIGEAASFIAFMKREENKWTRPQMAPFSGRYMDGDFSLSPDGKQLYFTSNRPVNGKINPDDYNLWIVSKTKTGWSEPKKLDISLNIHDNEYYPYSPSVTKDGTLYFYCRGKGSSGNWDIYYSRFVKGKYTKPERVSDSINSSNWDFDPYIAPDESYLIFSSVNREGGYGGSDLYISSRNKDGSWTETKNLGDKVNSSGWEICPGLSPDGKYLFFGSNRYINRSYPETPMTYDEIIKILNKEKNSPGNGHTDFYWVNAKIIKNLKNDELK
jgi:Tol biopolymer transport system component